MGYLFIQVKLSDELLSSKNFEYVGHEDCKNFG